MGLFDRSDLTIVVMDIEASAFGESSYPIEIGLARFLDSSRPIALWQTYVRPTAEWTRSGLWSKASAAVHGIRRNDLIDGRDPVVVAERLNVLLKGALVVTDAPSYDQAWLDRLYSAAARDQNFILNDFDFLSSHLRKDEYRQFIHLLRRRPANHRAGDDAVRLASALLEARIGFPPQVVEAPF